MSDELAARVALLSLPGLGPARANWLLNSSGAVEAVARLRSGRLPSDVGRAPSGVNAQLVKTWSAKLRSIDPLALLDENTSAGVEICDPDHASWPFTNDPEPPALFFYRGDLTLLDPGPVVAIVGTRRCTAIGREVAHEFGAALGAAGVVVVSGLAAGIDGAAHRGALSSSDRAVAVVGTGLDIIYPGANRTLWKQVADRGLLMSESPLGTRAERWRFPARNRLIAGLADVVIVVESHAEGGSLITVDQAIERARTVMVVPGSITSPASSGSNQLLLDGCQPACSVEDVLGVLDHDSPPVVPPEAHQSDAESVPTGDSPLARFVLAEVAAGAVHVDDLVVGSRAPIPEVLAMVQELQDKGQVVLDGSTVARPGQG